MTDPSDIIGRLMNKPESLRAALRHHIRQMYPQAVEAAPSTFLQSVGNSAYNQTATLCGEAAALIEAQAREIETKDAGWLPIVLCPTDGVDRALRLPDGREVVGNFDGSSLSRRRWQFVSHVYINPERPTGAKRGGVEQIAPAYPTHVIADLPEGVSPTHFRPNDTVYGRANALSRTGDGK